ncbi:uncharacterized protein UHOD_11162 [Ustilago sp. UG-2017b]|nr:uncharacterized protein UHOD_11162 [Ustilago sp. UG-2017b]
MQSSGEGLCNLRAIDENDPLETQRYKSDAWAQLDAVVRAKIEPDTNKRNSISVVGASRDRGSPKDPGSFVDKCQYDDRRPKLRLTPCLTIQNSQAVKKGVRKSQLGSIRKKSLCETRFETSPVLLTFPSYTVELPKSWLISMQASSKTATSSQA